jgi:hypothetical protein
MVSLAVDPTFDWLCGDPRFDELVARVRISTGGDDCCSQMRR